MGFWGGDETYAMHWRGVCQVVSVAGMGLWAYLGYIGKVSTLLAGVVVLGLALVAWTLEQR